MTFILRIPWSVILFEKLIVAPLIEGSPPPPEGSLSWSKDPSLISQLLFESIPLKFLLKIPSDLST
jgi:hypothetical protein